MNEIREPRPNFVHKALKQQPAKTRLPDKAPSRIYFARGGCLMSGQDKMAGKPATARAESDGKKGRPAQSPVRAGLFWLRRRHTPPNYERQTGANRFFCPVGHHNI